MANYACRRQFSAIKTNEPSALKPAHEPSDFLPGVIQMEASFHYLSSSFRGAFVRGRVFRGGILSRSGTLVRMEEELTNQKE